MLRNTRVQIAAVLAVAALLGYLTASGRLNPCAWAKGNESAAAASAKPAESGGGAQSACCGEVNKSRLLALADPKVAPQDEKGGEKLKVRAFARALRRAGPKAPVPRPIRPPPTCSTARSCRFRSHSLPRSPNSMPAK